MSGIGMTENDTVMGRLQLLMVQVTRVNLKTDLSTDRELTVVPVAQDMKGSGGKENIMEKGCSSHPTGIRCTGNLEKENCGLV